MSDVTSIGLEKQFRAKLDEWGLTKAQAAKLGVTLETAKKLTFVPANPPEAKGHVIGGIKIQYYDMDGKPMHAAVDAPTYHRYRYLFGTGGFLDLEKVCKYASEPGAPPLPYFPKNVDWHDVNNDINHPIFITEGEMKALKASKEGFPTIAFGGVDAFRSLHKRGQAFLPHLEAIEWYRRTVYIVYDSDIATKPDVSRAMNDLAQQLFDRGAVCQVVLLPGIPVDNPEGEDYELKCGFDDYLVEYSKDEFVALLDDPTFCMPLYGVKQLIDMNSQMTYVSQLNMTVELHDMHQSKVDTSYATRFSNIAYFKYTMDGDVVKAKAENVGKAWLNWPQRNQVANLTYAPGDDVYLEQDGRRLLNTWRGWGVETKRGSIKPFQNLINFLFRDCSDDELGWLWNWLAYPIQHPGTKLATSIVLHSIGQGTGKTLLGEIMGLIYGHNFTVIGQSHLQSDFTGWINSRQFILGDEISGTGTADARKVADRLKHYITGKTIQINQKFMPPYDIPNHTNFLFTSNHPDAFFVENDDRRFFVAEAPHKAEPKSFYNEIADWRDVAGPSALRYYLEEKDLKGFDPFDRAPLTSAKEQMIALSRGDLGQWVHDLVYGTDPIKLGKVDSKCELWTIGQLITLYDPIGEKRISNKAMANELRKNGVRPALQNNQIRLDNGEKVRLWPIRNQDKWVKIDTPGQLASHYTKYFATRNTIRDSVK